MSDPTPGDSAHYVNAKDMLSTTGVQAGLRYTW